MDGINYLHDFFLKSVEKIPYEKAVEFEGNYWSYHELYQQSYKIAEILTNIQHGTMASPCIALFGSKSLYSVAAIIGILMAGYAYMPIEKNTPTGRFSNILNIAKPTAILVTEDFDYLIKELASIPHSPKIIYLNKETLDKHTFIKKSKSKVEPHPNQLAYVLFTSGSTGVPKGVCMSHKAAVSAIKMYQDHINVSASDHIANIAPFTFDLSIFDIFSAFNAGALVCLFPSHIAKVPNRLLKALKDKLITIIFTVPSVLEYLLKYTENIEGLAVKKLLLSGEPISKNLHKNLCHLFSTEIEIWNLYGATEMPYVFAKKLQQEDGASINNFDLAGKDVTYELNAIEDTDFKELIIKSPALLSGYLTQDISFSSLQQGPVSKYKTGDLAISTLSGIMLNGRKDRQIKISGYRVELDEIEHQLEALACIKEAVVIYYKNDRKLVAFVTVSDPINQEEVKIKVETLSRKTFPTYMQPNEIIIVDEIPRTASFKKDRKKLAEVSKTL